MCATSSHLFTSHGFTMTSASSTSKQQPQTAPRRQSSVTSSLCGSGRGNVFLEIHFPSKKKVPPKWILVVLTILIHISQFCLVFINEVPQNGYWLVVLTILIHISQFFWGFHQWWYPQNGYWLVVLTILIHISQFFLGFHQCWYPQNGYWLVVLTISIHISQFFFGFHQWWYPKMDTGWWF